MVYSLHLRRAGDPTDNIKWTFTYKHCRGILWYIHCNTFCPLGSTLEKCSLTGHFFLVPPMVCCLWLQQWGPLGPTKEFYPHNSLSSMYLTLKIFTSQNLTPQILYVSFLPSMLLSSLHLTWAKENRDVFQTTIGRLPWKTTFF